MQPGGGEIGPGGQTPQNPGGGNIQKTQGFPVFAQRGGQGNHPGKIHTVRSAMIQCAQKAAGMQRVQYLVQDRSEAGFGAGKQFRHAKQIQPQVRMALHRLPQGGKKRQRDAGREGIAQVAEKGKDRVPGRRQRLRFGQKSPKLRKRAGLIPQGTEGPFHRFPVRGIGEGNPFPPQGGKQPPVRFP